MKKARPPAPHAAPTPEDFSTLFDFLPIGAYRSTPDGAQVRANPALVRLNGYATEAEMLAGVRDIATECYVDPGRRHQFRAELEATGQVRGFVAEVYRHKTRERIWVTENAHLVRDAAGAVLFYEGTIEEITDRVATDQALLHSQEVLREVMSRVPGFMYRLYTTPEGERRYSFVSDGVQALYGVAPAAVLADSKLLHRYRHPEDRDRVAADFDAATRSGLPLAAEFRIRLDDGSVKWVQMLSSPTPSAEGFDVRTGLMVDITERKQAEALRQERDLAEAANLAKTQFLSRVSHELRTPLNAILGFAQLLELDGSPNPKQRAWVLQILASGRHLLGLVDDVLDLSSAQTGLLAFDLGPVEPAEVVREVWAMLDAASAGAGLVFTDALPAALPAVLADRKRLKQVVSNLLSNAIKYNRPGGRITVDALDEGSAVLLRVADTGLGIQPDALELIFKPFERLGAQRTAVEGTGLGLALSRQLMLAMAGSISVDSVFGQGSTFSVRLPKAAG